MEDIKRLFSNKKSVMEEKRMITGETRDEAINRYRGIFADWEKLSFEEKKKRINMFRGGY